MLISYLLDRQARLESLVSMGFDSAQPAGNSSFKQSRNVSYR